MTYYGPWQESRIHEELFTLIDDTDVTHQRVTLLGEEPTVRSGWDADQIAALGWHVLASASGTFEQGISDPPASQPDLSAAAFGAALGEDVGSGGAVQFRMRESGDQTFWNPPPHWIQDQQWEMWGNGYRLWFNPALNTNTATDLYAIPVGMDNATDDYYIELETLGSPKPVEIVSAEVLAAPGSLFKLFVKDAHPTAAEPFLRSAVTQGGSPTSITDATAFPDADDDLPLDHATLNDLAENGTAYVGNWSLDGRMPTMSVLYVGPTRTDNSVSGVSYDSTYEGHPVRIRVRYRWPRWRQVFYEAPRPAYRRTWARDDALAGGAARTWPPSRSVQSSNRTFGGYL